MSTTARLFVDPMPELGEGVTRYTIDCRWSTTRVVLCPGELELPETTLVSAALMAHQENCGRCNLERLWQRRGDVKLRELTEEAWRQLGAVALRERRN